MIADIVIFLRSDLFLPISPGSPSSGHTPTTSPPGHRAPSSPELWSVTMVFVSFLSNAIITLNSYSVKRTSTHPERLCSSARLLISARVLCKSVTTRWGTLHHAAGSEVKADADRVDGLFVIWCVRP